MNFADLETFYEVARRGGFSQAASALRTAQSALSRRVARLEHQLGVKLFERHGRGVRLTADGQALMTRAEGLINELGAIASDIRGLSAEPTGRIVVAFTPNSGQILGPLLLKAAQAHPNLTIELREGFSGTIHEWLSEGRIDVALLYDPEQTPAVDVTPLLREPLLFAGAPAMMRRFRKGTVGTKALGELPLILPSRSHSLRRTLDRLSQQTGKPLMLRNQVDGTLTIKGVVAAGLGYTVFAYAGLFEEIRDGAIVALPFDPPVHWTFCLVTRRDARDLPSVRFVREAITSEVHRLVEGGLWQGTLLI